MLAGSLACPTYAGVMSADPIFWHLFVRAKREAGARKIVNRLARALELPIDVALIEPYWKIRGVHIVDFRTPAPFDSAAELVCYALLLGPKIGLRWIAAGPNLEPGGTWEFRADWADLEGRGICVPGPISIEVVCTGRTDDHSIWDTAHQALHQTNQGSESA